MVQTGAGSCVTRYRRTQIAPVRGLGSGAAHISPGHHGPRAGVGSSQGIRPHHASPVLRRKKIILFLRVEKVSPKLGLGCSTKNTPGRFSHRGRKPVAVAAGGRVLGRNFSVQGLWVRTT